MATTAVTCPECKSGVGVAFNDSELPRAERCWLLHIDVEKYLLV